MKEQFANNASTTLSASATLIATTITVVDASRLPAGPQYRIIIDTELMLVTAVSGNTLTVTRGAEGTTAATHGGGSAVTHILTLGALQTYGRDNEPFFDGVRPPFALQDASGNTLTSASFTTYNAAGDAHTAVVSDSDRRVTIKRPSGSGTGAEALTSLARTAPATPYSVTMALQPLVVTDNAKFSTFVGFRESSTGKSQVLRMAYFNPGNEFAINTFTNETGAGFVALADFPLLAPVQWYKLADDGSNLTYYFGDGVNWVPIYSPARTSNFTSYPDEVVWGCGANSNPFDNFCTLVSWSE